MVKILLDNMSDKTYYINGTVSDCMENYEISFYRTVNGVEPAADFIRSLQPKMQAKMLRTDYWKRCEQ